jgi:hypothetical protein
MCTVQLAIRFEAVPLEQAAEAYARMMEGNARFRIALVSKDGVSRQTSVRSRSSASR